MSKSVPKPEDPPTWQMQESSFPRKASVYPFCPGWIQYWSGSCHLYWFHARICTAPQWWSPPGWSGRAQGIEYTLKFLLRHFCNWRMLAKWWKTVLVWRWRSKGIDYPLALRRRQFDRWRMARYGGSTPRRILPLSPISATWMTAMVFRIDLSSCACCSMKFRLTTVTSSSPPSFVSLRGILMQTNVLSEFGFCPGLVRVQFVFSSGVGHRVQGSEFGQIVSPGPGPLSSGGPGPLSSSGPGPLSSGA